MKTTCIHWLNFDVKLRNYQVFNIRLPVLLPQLHVIYPLVATERVYLFAFCQERARIERKRIEIRFFYTHTRFSENGSAAICRQSISRSNWTRPVLLRTWSSMNLGLPRVFH